jgi:hypothetical protein
MILWGKNDWFDILIPQVIEIEWVALVLYKKKKELPEINLIDKK